MYGIWIPTLTERAAKNILKEINKKTGFRGSVVYRYED